MDATSCFARHVQSRDHLPALVDALSIHGAFQTAHAVVDHRGDDGNVKRLAGNLSSFHRFVTVRTPWKVTEPPFGSNKTYRSFLVEYGIQVRESPLHYTLSSTVLSDFNSFESVARETPHLGTINDVVEEFLAASSFATGFIPGLAWRVSREWTTIRILLLAMEFKARQQRMHHLSICYALKETLTTGCKHTKAVQTS